MNRNTNRLSTDPARQDDQTDVPDAAEFGALIEQSSLGTPAVRALRDRSPVPDIYQQGSLTESDLAATWHEQLLRWLADAVRAGVTEPNAMVLATTNAEGVPSSRTVLAKGLDVRGLVFFTNYTSAKSHDLLATRYASATFPWYQLQRQATVRGTVERVSATETAAYWASRPRGSQLGAWASPQSSVVSGREGLYAALSNVKRHFADADVVPVPPHWGGWRIRAEVVEFWQGRADRMHDRLRCASSWSGTAGTSNA